jgi:hypothetical protein
VSAVTFQIGHYGRAFQLEAVTSADPQRRGRLQVAALELSKVGRYDRTQKVPHRAESRRRDRISLSIAPIRHHPFRFPVTWREVESEELRRGLIFREQNSSSRWLLDRRRPNDGLIDRIKLTLLLGSLATSHEGVPSSIGNR